MLAHDLGTFYASETGSLLARDPDPVRAPDFAFSRGVPDVREPGFVSGAPELVVEVLSPDDRPGYVSEKTAEWLEAGAVEVWVVRPRQGTLTVHRTEWEPVELGEGEDVPGGDLLPGLELAVRDLFV